MRRRFFPSQLTQQIPGRTIALEGVLRPAIAPTEPEASAPPAGALQVVWSAATNSEIWSAARKGTNPAEGEWANLHEWRPGDTPITPIAIYRFYQTMVLVATVHGAAPGAEIVWALESDSSAVAVQPDPDLGEPVLSGTSCVLLFDDPWDYETVFVATLTATVDGVEAGSVTVHWAMMAS
jgi:hypothetical protein